MREAIRYGRAFNAIHFATGFKIDVFPLQKDAFHAGELARSEKRVWEVEPAGSMELQVASAEDTILEKLLWYKRGGQISSQQWSDVLGVATTGRSIANICVRGHRGLELPICWNDCSVRLARFIWNEIPCRVSQPSSPRCLSGE